MALRLAQAGLGVFEESQVVVDITPHKVRVAPDGGYEHHQPLLALEFLSRTNEHIGVPSLTLAGHQTGFLNRTPDGAVGADSAGDRRGRGHAWCIVCAYITR